MDKVICVGKNYLAHASELGDAVPEDAIYFLKPPSAVFDATAATTLQIPKGYDVHHEVELVLRLEKAAKGWRFSHYTIGLDLTLRDLQTRLKKNGHPWEKAKVFKNAAVIGAFFPIADFAKLMARPFALEVDGQVRQRGLPSDMRFHPEAMLKDLESWLPLREGDLFFTGTPAGAGPLQNGDKLKITGGEVGYSLTCEQ